MGNSFPILATEGYFLPGEAHDRISLRYHEGKANRSVRFPLSGKMRTLHFSSSKENNDRDARGGKKKGLHYVGADTGSMQCVVATLRRHDSRGRKSQVKNTLWNSGSTRKSLPKIAQ